MKILKIFGIVVGIHVFALILIFANPGCSSTSKPAPAPTDTMSRAEPSPTVSVPINAPMTVSPGFDPNAPAVATTASASPGSGIRFTPTRPNTPAANAVTAAPVSDVTPVKETYTVKAGDTFWELGKKFGIPYADIAAANNLKSSAALHAGQKLIIPGKKPAANAPAALNATKAGAAPATTAKAPAAASTTATAGSSNAMKHTVKPGETLSTIAKQYGVTTRELGAANNISDPQKIRAGMELVIPGWNAAGGANAKSTSKSSAKSADPAKTATPPADTKPMFSIDPNAPAPQSSQPPVLKVDDNPLAPAPKSN